MTTEDLISYIKKQIANNVSKELIVSKLLQVGWRMEDIDEGFMIVEKPEPNKTEEVVVANSNQAPEKIETKPVDDYREPTTDDNFSKPLEPAQVEHFEEKTKKEDVFSRAGIEIEEGPKMTEELIPNLIPKVEPVEPTIEPSIEPTAPMTPTIPTMPVEAPKETKPVEVAPSNPVIVQESKGYQIKDLPKIAMISSYDRDVESVQSVDNMRIAKEGKEVVPPVVAKKKSKKWLLFVIIIVVLLGVSFVFANNYFNVRNISFSLIKKDPRVLLLNNSSILSSLESYKTETNVEISMPSFSNISAGLVSGEAVVSDDQDTLSINTIGRINKNSNGLMSDNFVTIKSSILDDYITTDVKNNGTSMFLSVPDLSQLLGDDAPGSVVVRVNEDQALMVPSILPEKIQDKFTKVNLYRILSQSISSFLDNETLDLYNQFINDAVITEKGEENIKGINTYHYVIGTDKQLSKKLLDKIFENFTHNLSEEDQAQLSEIVGSTNISSFEVWVGKKDNNIYQYKVVLTVPLSRILNFEDKSIGDNKVNVDWTTTYYDFGVTNNIFMPEQFVTIDEFTNIMNEKHLKNDVSSLKKYATSLRNVEGSYGAKANSTGSCMSPVSGSLFSPTGHTKSALDSVSSISLLLNRILEKTYGQGTCYSTPSAWSFSIPITDNYNPSSPQAGTYASYFCTDSTGEVKDLPSSPTGVVCK